MGEVARGPGSGGALGRLAADVARLCHASEAVLSCGTQRVAGWNAAPGPRCLIAAQPFGVGADAYQLCLYDTHPRELTPLQCGAFQAMTEAFHRELAQRPPPEAAMGSDWVRDHVAAALDYVTDSFLLVLDDWSIQHVNTQFERVAQRPRADLVGRVLWDALPGLVGTRVEAELRAAMSGTVPRVFEAFNPPLGRWFQSRAFPCHEGLAVLTLDVTADREAGSEDAGAHAHGHVPAAAPPADTAPPPARPAPRGRGERVAYVDDDDVVRLMVQRVLERTGFVVTSYADPLALLSDVRARSDCYDLLVTDFSMPGMDGLQLARAVRGVCPTIPIILATGHAWPDLVQAVDALGGAQILHKEVTFEELGERAARALRDEAGAC